MDLDQKDSCYIDEDTSRALELIHNNIDVSNKNHSLFGLLDSSTSTTCGSRLLLESIRQPLCDLATIEQRLDCVEYLASRVDTLSNLSNNIKKLGQGVDLDSVVPATVNLFKARSETLQVAEKKLEAITIIENLVSHVPMLVGILEGADQPTMNIYRTALTDPAFDKIVEDLNAVLEQDLKVNRGKRSKMFRIKQGVESLFDIARSTYMAAIEDLEQYVRSLAKEDGIPWKLTHGETRGYYLILNRDQVPKNLVLDNKYMQVNKSRTTITCVTRDMMQSNVRANLSYENSMKLANEILTSTLSSVMINLHAIHKLVEIIGSLDLLTCFAKTVVTSNGSLVRPKFTTSDTMIVKGRHILLESVLKFNNLKVVPNDAFFSRHKNFMLVTGPNMGGKSIFLRQVALIQIMAQMGCFVPAESAHIKLMNRIVARTGTSDDIQSNCSSFMWEMRGIASALKVNQVCNESVLFVIDEVGRGTSIDDGASYSFAIAEELANRKNCFTIFTTHFEQVFLLPTLYANIRAYYFKYEEESEEETGRKKLKLSHSLTPGLCEKDHYGIRLAEAVGLPSEILDTARQGLKISLF